MLDEIFGLRRRSGLLHEHLGGGLRMPCMGDGSVSHLCRNSFHGLHGTATMHTWPAFGAWSACCVTPGMVTFH